MSKYPKLEHFEPTLEEQKAKAEELAKHLSPTKAVVLDDGSQVQGKRKIAIEESEELAVMDFLENLPNLYKNMNKDSAEFKELDSLLKEMLDNRTE